MMKKLMLLLTVAFLLSFIACEKLISLPDENQVKSDLLGKKIMVNGEEVWSFDALGEFISLRIVNTQQAGKTAELTINSCLKNVDGSSNAYMAEFLCTYQLQGNTWVLNKITSKKFNEIDESGNILEEQTNSLAEGQFNVAAGGMKWWEFTITPEMKSATVVGKFEAQGGEGNDINVFIAEAKEFAKYKSGRESNVFYDSDNVSTGELNESLEPGHYFLVFNNQFSTISTKSVKAEINLTYGTVAGTSSACR